MMEKTASEFANDDVRACGVLVESSLVKYTIVRAGPMNFGALGEIQKLGLIF
jgi:hypothetical protein